MLNYTLHRNLEMLYKLHSSDRLFGMIALGDILKSLMVTTWMFGTL